MCVCYSENCECFDRFSKKVMPPEMAVSMRHTKLKPEEAALLAGEISKPTWESKNEGIHERVSFEDSIWGFDLAGGSYYKTPLRVTSVKPESRAEKAGIRPGDKLLRINDIDTSTLTIQEAHEMIIESGIHLKLSVTSPDDDEDAYYCYEDPIVDGYDSEEERRLEEERAKKRRVHAKVSSFWSLQWPWVSKRRLIYRESNCFMVNSKYEETRREKYPPLPAIRYTDDILMYQKDGERQDEKQTTTEKPEEKTQSGQRVTNGDVENDVTLTDDEELNHVSEAELSENRDSSISPVAEEAVEVPTIEEPENFNDSKDIEHKEPNDRPDDALSPIPEIVEESLTPDITETEEVEEEIEEAEEEIEDAEEISNADDVINEVLAKSSDSQRSDEDNILDSILSDDGQNLESSEANNER